MSRRLLTNRGDARRFQPSVVNPTVRRGNLCYRRNSAPESGAIFVPMWHPAMAGGRGYKGRKVTNNSACPMTGFQPPAASGAVESLVGDVQSSSETIMTAHIIAQHSALILSKSDIATTNGEARIRDVRLGEVLGLSQPLNIRSVIAANIAELKGLGEVLTQRVKTLPQGGRPGTEYWLNEAQALLICMFARTERAAEVRKQLIEVFMAWRRGEAEKQPERKEYVPVLTLAQQIDLAVYGAKLYLGEPRRDEILEHVFLALRTAEQTRMMKMDVIQHDEVRI